uniref:E4 protein n=1 Tax=Human papillomavirus TaxID=10566 RepID=A0A385PM09_9PAPI|nr:MAG: E4 protein [Human papillomavirus]
MRMLTGILLLDNGLCHINTQLLLLLSPALPGTPGTPKKASPGLGTPGSPHRRKVLVGGDNLHGILKKFQQPPPHRRPQAADDDEEEEEEEENHNDENKENTPPENPQEPKDNEGPLHRLLRKWEEDINRFRDTVWTDLEDFKKRLGIHLLSV